MHWKSGIRHSLALKKEQNVDIEGSELLQILAAHLSPIFNIDAEIKKKYQRFLSSDKTTVEDILKNILKIVQEQRAALKHFQTSIAEIKQAMITELLQLPIKKEKEFLHKTDKVKKAYDLTDKLLDMRTFADVLFVLKEIKDGIELSREKGHTEKSLELETMLIKIRDEWIIDKLLLADVIPINAKELLFNFQFISNDRDSSDRALALLDKIKNAPDVQPHEISSKKIAYVKNVFSAPQRTNWQSRPIEDYVRSHGAELKSILEELMTASQEDTSLNKKEIHTYAFALNHLMTTYWPQADNTSLTVDTQKINSQFVRHIDGLPKEVDSAIEKQRSLVSLDALKTRKDPRPQQSHTPQQSTESSITLLQLGTQEDEK